MAAEARAPFTVRRLTRTPFARSDAPPTPIWANNIERNLDRSSPRARAPVCRQTVCLGLSPLPRLLSTMNHLNATLYDCVRFEHQRGRQRRFFTEWKLCGRAAGTPGHVRLFPTTSRSSNEAPPLSPPPSCSSLHRLSPARLLQSSVKPPSARQSLCVSGTAAWAPSLHRVARARHPRCFARSSATRGEALAPVFAP